MSNTTEQRTVVEVGGDFTITGNITRVSVKGKKIEIYTIPGYPDLEEIKGTQEYIEKYFPIVRASTLRLNDDFLRHNPTTTQQKEFKADLIWAIKSRLSDFRAQRMDACFDEEGNICFKAGMKPAVGKGKLSANDWKRVAKEFLPEKGSRLGTTRERIAFLGLLIKYLIEEKGYSVSDAWKAVCDQSKDLGHYLDSENAKDDFEPTGSRQVGEWYDLGNTCKITVNDVFVEYDVFSSFGANYTVDGENGHLSGYHRVSDNDAKYASAVLGWIVLWV